MPLSYEDDTIYELLLKRYENKGFLNPKAVLDSCIQNLRLEGLTRTEAIQKLHTSDEPWIYSPATPSSDSLQQKATARDSETARQIANLKEKIDSLTRARYPSEPSLWWWAVPFFFGILGGIIAYVGVKNEDQDMANNLLTFGVVWTFVLAILGWIIFLH